MFSHIIGEKGDSAEREIVLSTYSDMYGKLLDMQHIDFRILTTSENGLASLYTIKSSISLLLFEMAQAIKVERPFVTCQNCG